MADVPPPAGTGPAVPLRQAQKALTRQRLLDAALELFAERGYAATTVEDVAVAAGATRATVYLHFRTKADLVRELGAKLTTEVVELHEVLRAVVAGGERQAVAGWLDDAFTFWERRRALTTVQEAASLVDAPTAEHRDAMIEGGVAAVAAGLADAGLFDEAGRRVRGVLLYAQLQNLFFRFMRSGWDVPRTEALEVMADMWMTAIRPPRRRPAPRRAPGSTSAGEVGPRP